LSLLEHAIYRLLLDTYYLEEQPLCEDHATLMRTHSVNTTEERRAFENIIKDFFELREDGYHNVQCDEELAKIYSKSEKARKSAEARWLKQKGKSNANASGMRTQCERNANGMLPTTHNPLPITQEDQAPLSVPLVPTCKHNEIIQIYLEVLPELPGIVLARYKGSVKEKNLKARWREDKAHQDLDFWKVFFGIVKTNPHWMGENDRGWKADFEWLLKRNNFDKVIQRGMG